MIQRIHPVGARRWRIVLFVAWALGGFAATNAARAADRITEIEPRVWSCEFPSVALGRTMRFLVVLPEGLARDAAPVPVIYVLHGRGRHERTLLDDAYSRRVLLASRCAIVLPRGLDGWYMDSPVVAKDRFAAYVDEVMARAEADFPLRRDGAGRAITGWSMGGYGAAYTFMRRRADFAALATIIGIVNYPRSYIEPVAENYPVQPRFGEDPEVWRRLNPTLLLAQAEPGPLFVAYADQAAERQMNESFIAAARARGFVVTEMRIPGGHVFPVVRLALPAALAFLEQQLLPAGPNPPTPAAKLPAIAP